MEWILILGVLFVAYQSGALRSIGVGPGADITPATGQLFAQQSYQMSQLPGQFNYDSTKAIGTDIAQGAANNGLFGAIQGAITGIFQGMAVRAKQAGIENGALNYAVAGFDQAIAQINQAYLSGSMTPAEAINLIQLTYKQYWQVTVSKIQPNRNGCSSGSNCPGTALQYADTNGVFPNFCTVPQGATCCVGCGPIRLSVERMIMALQSGGGVSDVAPIGGDKYGLQTRLGYTLSWQKVGVA